MMFGVSLNSLPQKSVLPLHQWQGKSGRWYPHSVITRTEQLIDCRANYVMVRRNSDGTATALYIGKADNLRQRFLAHEKVDPAFRLGANELHIHLLALSEDELLSNEKDLIEGQKPELNVQHNSGQENLGNMLSAFAEQNLKNQSDVDWISLLELTQPKKTEYSDLAALLGSIKFAEQNRKSQTDMDWISLLELTQPKKTEYSDLAALLGSIK